MLLLREAGSNQVRVTIFRRQWQLGDRWQPVFIFEHQNSIWA
jgi:hypothetical protein